MFSTTEITSHEEVSDNVIHQRLFYAYLKAAELIGGNVLEIGCGAGRGLETVLGASENYTAIDKNKPLLDFLQEKYPSSKFLHQNIPPFKDIPDNHYDFVISFQVIEHIQDDHFFMKEIHRVLKSGGQAILTTPNIKLSLTRNPWHIREYTPEQFTELGEKYFEEVEVKGITGNQKVMDYYEKNKASVGKITRLDILNLQYRLPRRVLQVPYEILNRMNRKKLMTQNNSLVSEVSPSDYSLVGNAVESFDLFGILRK